MTASETIDCASYEVTDSFFGAPYIDVDEWRDTPLRHRHVHGGFADCDTRFSMYFPRAGRVAGPRHHAPRRRPRRSRGRVRRGHGRPARWSLPLRPPRWLHGRVEHGPHRRRHRSEGRRRPDDLRLARRGGDGPPLQARRRAGLRRGTPPQLRVGWERRRSALTALPRERARRVRRRAPVHGRRQRRAVPGDREGQERPADRVRLHVQPAADVAPRRPARASDRRHAARWEWEPVRGPEQPRTRRARLPLRAGLPVRRRAHDLLPDGADLAVDVDRRPPRRAGPDVLHQLLDRARVHRSRPAVGGGGRRHRRRHHREQGHHRERSHERSRVRRRPSSRWPA